MVDVLVMDCPHLTRLQPSFLADERRLSRRRRNPLRSVESGPVSTTDRQKTGAASTFEFRGAPLSESSRSNSNRLNDDWSSLLFRTADEKFEVKPVNDVIISVTCTFVAGLARKQLNFHRSLFLINVFGHMTSFVNRFFVLVQNGRVDWWRHLSWSLTSLMAFLSSVAPFLYIFLNDPKLQRPYLVFRPFGNSFVSWECCSICRIRRRIKCVVLFVFFFQPN